MAAIVQQSTQDSLDILEDKIEYLLKFVTIISELVLLVGLGYAGFKLAHKGATPDTLDQIWLVSQVLALDLSAPGLFAMAKRAKEQGEEQRAAWAIKIAVILIIMSILTMAEGAVTSYIPNISQDVIRYVTLAMMIIRGGAAVGYSVFRRLHKTERQSITPAQPAPAAAPIDYSEIARQLLPLVAQIVPDTTGMVEQLTQLRNDMEALTQQSAQQSEVSESNNPVNNDAQIVDIEEYRHEQQPAQQPRAKVTRKLSTRSETPGATKNAPTAKQKALKVLQRNPDVEPVELARKAGITRQYASKILASQKG